MAIVIDYVPTTPAVLILFYVSANAFDFTFAHVINCYVRHMQIFSLARPDFPTSILNLFTSQKK